MGIILVLLIILGLFSILDIKFKAIPSIYLTGMILVTAVVHFITFENGLIFLSFGILSFVYAWMLYEGKFFTGIADVKVLTIIGLTITKLPFFFVMMILTVVIGLGYQLFFKFVLKKEDKDLIPFVPALYIVYVILVLLGGVS